MFRNTEAFSFLLKAGEYCRLFSITLLGGGRMLTSTSNNDVHQTFLTTRQEFSHLHDLGLNLIGYIEGLFYT